MALLIRDLPEYIKDKLRKRRSPIEAQRPKSAWFRFTSNANPEGQPSGQILMGGAFEPSNERFGKLRAGFSGQYDLGDGGGARPEPGAQSMTVSIEGGDISASVDWKCWTPDQLERLAPYFLSPGMSVIMEMGWSTITGTQLQAMVNVNSEKERRALYRNKPEDSGEDGPIYTLDGRGGPVHPLQERRKQGGGNYEVFVGQIGDFDVDYNESGGFDCTTEVVGVAKTAVIAIRAVDQKSRTNDASAESGAKKKPTMFEFITEGSAASASRPRGSAPGTIDQVKGDETESGNWSSVGQYEYLSWGAVERKVLNPYVSYRNAVVKGQNVMSWDSSQQPASYFPGLLSTDPSVCVVVPEDTAMPAGETIRGFTRGSESDSPKRGLTYNLYVTKKLIKETTKQNKNSTIGDIVLRMLEKCSTACFGIWDFTIQEEANNLKVVDRNATGVVAENDSVFSFRPFTTDTVLTSFSIDVTMDDLTKSQVMLASRVDDTGRDEGHDVNGGTGSGLSDLFGKVEDPVFPSGLENPAEPTPAPKENQNPQGGVPPVRTEQAAKGEELAVLDTPEKELPEGLRYNRVESWKDLQMTRRGARELRQEIENDTEEDSPVNANQNLPVDVSIELKGIGGITKYQSFDVANLPESLSQGLFMVKKVEHSVSDNEWVTSVEGQYRTENQSE